MGPLMALPFAARVSGVSGRFVSKYWAKAASFVYDQFPLAKTLLGYMATRPAMAQYAQVLVEHGASLSTRTGFGAIVNGMGRSMQNLVKQAADSVASVKLAGGNVIAFEKFQVLSAEFATANVADKSRILGVMLQQLGKESTNLTTIFGEKKAWGVFSAIGELSIYATLGLYFLDEPEDRPITDDTAKNLLRRTYDSLASEMGEVIQSIRLDHPEYDEAAMLLFEQALFDGFSLALSDLDLSVNPTDGLGSVPIDASTASVEAEKVRSYFVSHTGSEAEASRFVKAMYGAFKLLDDGVDI